MAYVGRPDSASHAVLVRQWLGWAISKSSLASFSPGGNRGGSSCISFSLCLVSPAWHLRGSLTSYKKVQGSKGVCYGRGERERKKKKHNQAEAVAFL